MSSSSVDDKLAELIAQAEHAGIVKTARAIFQLLEDKGLAQKMRIPPSMVGVHPQNRDGVAISGHDCHRLLIDIFEVGWADDEVCAVCTESDEASKEFNIKLMQENSLLLPQYPSKECVRYLSLSASHTNQALRCVHHGISFADDRLSSQGKLSLDRIASKDPAMASAVQTGLMWLVLPARVMQDHPTLPGLIQAAMNCGNQVARAEFEIQTLRKLHTIYVNEKKRKGASRVEFSDVKRIAMLSKPKCAESLPSMFAFILKASGGENATFLSESESFIKAQTSASKSLGHEVFSALSIDVKGNEGQLIRLRHALLKLGYCRHVSAGEIKRALNSTDAQVAESLLGEVRTLVGSDSGSLCTELGTFDMNIAARLAGTPRSKSFAYYAHSFIVKASDVASVPFTNRFEDAAKDEIEAESKTVTSEPKQTTGITPLAYIRFSLCLFSSTFCNVMKQMFSARLCSHLTY